MDILSENGLEKSRYTHSMVFPRDLFVVPHQSILSGRTTSARHRVVVVRSCHPGSVPHRRPTDSHTVYVLYTSPELKNIHKKKILSKLDNRYRLNSVVPYKDFVLVPTDLKRTLRTR